MRLLVYMNAAADQDMNLLLVHIPFVKVCSACIIDGIYIIKTHDIHDRH